MASNTTTATTIHTQNGTLVSASGVLLLPEATAVDAVELEGVDAVELEGWTVELTKDVFDSISTVVDSPEVSSGVGEGVGEGVGAGVGDGVGLGVGHTPPGGMLTARLHNPPS